jgi:hypothetical protein
MHRQKIQKISKMNMILLFSFGIAANFFIFNYPFPEPHDCKWNVYDHYDNPVDGTTAIFYTTRNDNIIFTGPSNFKFDKLYILKGNDSESLVYLSNKLNNSDAGDWTHIEYITRKKNDTEEQKNITIEITNDYFFDFFVKDYHKTQSISKDGIICYDDKYSKGCGCSSENCEKRRTDFRVENFRFDKEEKTLTLELHANFDYTKIYHFQMNLDTSFKSMLTLKFDVTTIWQPYPVVIQTTLKATSVNITVSELCAKVFNSNSSSTEFSINGKNNTNCNDLEINEISNKSEVDSEWFLTQIKPNHQINFQFRPGFNYSRTYCLKCSENCSHSKMAFKFDIKKEMASASLGVGVASTLALIIIGGVIVIAKKKQLSKKKKTEKQDSLLTTLIEEDPMVDLCDRKFPQSTVKAWKDITLERELGAGQFGKVYKGFLNTQYTR